MKFKTRRRKRREAIEEAKAKEKKLATKPEPNTETKKKIAKEEKPNTKINLPPRRKTKQKNGT